jgi:hypothetical protein
MSSQGYRDRLSMYAAVYAQKAMEEKMAADKFEERMITSNRDRRLVAARTALEGLQRDVEYALLALGKGDNPNIDLHAGAIKAETALSELSAIDEIVVIFKETRGDV